MTGFNVASTTLLFRKLFLDEDIRLEDVEEGSRPSDVLLEYDDPGKVEHVYEHAFEIPAREFLEILSTLPDFNALPVFGELWEDSKRPTSFLLTSHEIDDKLFVDAQGYDYPRYKAYVFNTKQVD